MIKFGTWTIFTFSHSRSRPFILLFMKVKTQVFMENGKAAVSMNLVNFSENSKTFD